MMQPEVLTTLKKLHGDTKGITLSSVCVNVSLAKLIEAWDSNDAHEINVASYKFNEALAYFNKYLEKFAIDGTPLSGGHYE